MRTGLKTAGNTPFTLSAGFIPSFNSSATTISKTAGVKYFNYAFTFDPAYSFPLGIEAGFASEISLRQKIDQFDQNHNIVLLNPYLEKKFLPGKGLTLRLSVNDVLNQNRGIVRDIYPYYTEERSYLTYKRYGMIRLSYQSVNKGGTAVDTS